jgi:hypothetical protein
MARRYPNLYDLDRWRRFGFGVLVVGLLSLGGALLAFALSGSGPLASDLLLLAAAGIGLAISFWMRQRWSYAQVDGHHLVVRVLMMRARIDIEQLRRARVARLGAAVDRWQGRGSPARVPRRFQDRDALVLRLRDPDDGKLRRLLSRRCVFEDEVAVPFADAALLQREIEAALGSPHGGDAGAGEGEPRGARARTRRRGRRR